MQDSPNSQSRKKFLLWGAVVLSSVTFFKFLTGQKKKESNTIKMLTQDGKLVEINKDLLVSSGKKISNDELKQWIKK
jgi:hypothetical protein